MDNFDTHKWFKKQYLEESNINEGKEHSSTVEDHELLKMVEDGLVGLQPGNDLIIRVNVNVEGLDPNALYLNKLYDVEFETLGNDTTNPDEDVNWMREGKMKKK
jgi:hypothetical protein